MHKQRIVMERNAVASRLLIIFVVGVLNSGTCIFARCVDAQLRHDGLNAGAVRLHFDLGFPACVSAMHTHALLLV